MILEEFEPGAYFFTQGVKWFCLDKGTYMVVAIRVKSQKKEVRIDGELVEQSVVTWDEILANLPYFWKDYVVFTSDDFDKCRKSPVSVPNKMKACYKDYKKDKYAQTPNVEEVKC